jgi:hypothetical protein
MPSPATAWGSFRSGLGETVADIFRGYLRQVGPEPARSVGRRSERLRMQEPAVYAEQAIQDEHGSPGDRK